MRTSILLLVSTVLVSVSSHSRADTLDWNACVSEAAGGNADLTVARENLRAAQFRTRAAFGPFLPEISGNLGYSRGDAGAGAQNSYSLSLDASQNLFSGFQDRARLDQASANQDLALASRDAAWADVSYELMSAFAGLSFAQESVKLSESIAKRRTDNLELVELRYRGGRENKGSYFLSKAALSQARFEILQANDDIFVGRQRLARAVGRDDADALAVTGEVPISEPESSPEFTTLVRQTPTYRRSLAEEHVAEAELAAARAQFYPSLDLSGGIGRQGSDWFPGDTWWNVGLALSIPLFSGGRDYYTAKAAASNLASAFSSRSSVARDLRTKLRQAHRTFVEAVEKLNVDTEFLEAASVRAEIARNKYNNGLLSFEDWDIIENDLIARQKAVLQSRRDRIVAEAAWNQVKGKGIIP